MRFVMLVPKSLDPVARGRKMPLPDPRPSAKIARLFPQVDPLKDQQKDPRNAVKPPDAAVPNPKASATEPAKNATPAQPPQAVAGKVPLPEARPNIEPRRRGLHRRRVNYYRRNR